MVLNFKGPPMILSNWPSTAGFIFSFFSLIYFLFFFFCVILKSIGWQSFSSSFHFSLLIAPSPGSFLLPLSHLHLSPLHLNHKQKCAEMLFFMKNMWTKVRFKFLSKKRVRFWEAVGIWDHMLRVHFSWGKLIPLN